MNILGVFAEKLPGSTIHIVPIEADKEAVPRSCYTNVERMIEKFGGSTVEGWEIMGKPGHHLALIHHAIWRKPDGSLLDPTPGSDQSEIVFATLAPGDPSFQGGIIAKRFIPLSDDQATLADVEQLRQDDLQGIDEDNRVRDIFGKFCDEMESRMKTRRKWVAQDDGSVHI
jgi:hypothetical protein